MNKQQENRFTMYNAVNKYLGENPETTGTIQAFNENCNAFSEKCIEIKLKDDTKKTVAVGKTISKLNARESAITRCLLISAGLFAYAKKTNNDELAELSDIQRSRLEMMRDTELIETLESVYELAKARSAEGVTYGFGETELESYRLIIQKYDDAFGRSQTGMLKRKVAVKSLVELFSEAGAILEVIDKYVHGMRETHSDFAAHYNDARVIRHLGLRHRKDEQPVTPPDNQTPQTQVIPVSNGTNAPPVN